MKKLKSITEKVKQFTNWFRGANKFMKAIVIVFALLFITIVMFPFIIDDIEQQEKAHAQATEKAEAEKLDKEKKAEAKNLAKEIKANEQAFKEFEKLKEKAVPLSGNALVNNKEAYENKLITIEGGFTGLNDDNFVVEVNGELYDFIFHTNSYKLNLKKPLTELSEGETYTFYGYFTFIMDSGKVEAPVVNLLGFE